MKIEEALREAELPENIIALLARPIGLAGGCERKERNIRQLIEPYGLSYGRKTNNVWTLLLNGDVIWASRASNTAMLNPTNEMSAAVFIGQNAPRLIYDDRVKGLWYELEAYFKSIGDIGGMQSANKAHKRYIDAVRAGQKCCKGTAKQFGLSMAWDRQSNLKCLQEVFKNKHAGRIRGMAWMTDHELLAKMILEIFRYSAMKAKIGAKQ